MIRIVFFCLQDPIEGRIHLIEERMSKIVDTIHVFGVITIRGTCFIGGKAIGACCVHTYFHFQLGFIEIIIIIAGGNRKENRASSGIGRFERNPPFGFIPKVNARNVKQIQRNVDRLIAYTRVRRFLYVFGLLSSKDR